MKVYMNLTHFFNKPRSIFYIIFLLPHINVHQLLLFVINLKNNFTPYWEHKQWLREPSQVKLNRHYLLQSNNHVCYQVSVYHNTKISNKILFITMASSNVNKFNFALQFNSFTPLIQITSLIFHYLNFYNRYFNSAAILFLLNFKKFQYSHLQNVINKASRSFISKNDYYISPLLINNIKNI